MPTYQYACTACDERLEAVQSFTDAPLTECPVCQGALRKVFSAVGVVFKGSGFYKNDSREKRPAAKDSSGSGDSGGDKATADGAKSDSGGSAKTDSSASAGSAAPATPAASGSSGSSSSGSSSSGSSSGSSGSGGKGGPKRTPSAAPAGKTA